MNPEGACEPVVAVVVETLDGGILDGAVHLLDLSVGPGMINLARHAIEDVVERIFVTGVGW